MNFFNLQRFGLAAKPSPQADHYGRRIPAPGEKCWYLSCSDKSPWPRKKEGRPVEILDVRAGWVRYKIGNALNDERQTLEDFLKMYRAFDGGEA
jgi:hypothetical protein